MPGRAAPPPDLIAEIESGLAARAPRALADHPIAAYLAAFDRLPSGAPYHAVPDEARATCAAIERVGGWDAVEAYHRLVLLHLIARTYLQGSRASTRLTADACALRDDYLARVLADVARGRRGFFRHGHDPFAKDFAVCRGRLLPCGVELLDPLGGIPRRLAWRGGRRGGFLRQAFTMARAVRRLGGVQPVWGLHFDRRLVGQFNPAGYAALYLRVADLLTANPDIGGISSGSWWHDPQVARISPELAFIGAIPERNGAFVLRVGESPHATNDALRFAPERTALYKAGHYRPCSYMLVWARQDVLAWASAYCAAVSAGSEQRSMPVA